MMIFQLNLLRNFILNFFQNRNSKMSKMEQIQNSFFRMYNQIYAFNILKANKLKIKKVVNLIQNLQTVNAYNSQLNKSQKSNMKRNLIKINKVCKFYQNSQLNLYNFMIK
ncbi:hypothetical protein TTHERM_000558438 (macronuclear) [Tetrahymena thermophila SB210]|uniref:Uncharacterized protein n=1 Tax=Tetrahymena thermophila (strain SB210) TaxID=312017 RepID=W7X8L5_TETTS|nr:hypothetical protein TTHERM_000558438 [Tetrahymena thermophila SB210]EWS72748.1 hypothetical protein TTHERM_000558438 [Tetrahymena thermophila SB210]|eukprot:XP_012654726.1 hypothetical protein TTHERM_000558438 [Tetrahymena thermophila SB210]